MGPKEFLEKVNSDDGFAKKYSKLTSLDAILAQAEADGYSVSKEDALNYIAKFYGGDLPDEELAAVAGGSKSNPPVPASIKLHGCSMSRKRAGLHCR
jgi:predicted ribosomally synthesized peptide with nif11-like leader